MTTEQIRAMIGNNKHIAAVYDNRHDSSRLLTGTIHLPYGGDDYVVFTHWVGGEDCSRWCIKAENVREIGTLLPWQGRREAVASFTASIKPLLA